MVTRKSEKDSTSKDPNPNMRTKSWGPPAWFATTCFLMGYPKNNPPAQTRKLYKSYLILFGRVLPCNLCRDSYAIFIKKLPMSDKVMSSRKTLVMWFFTIHNMVNKKIGCKLLTKVQMEKKYNYYDKFRAVKCSKDLGGCLKSASNVRTPKRTKVITFIDEEAMKLKNK